MPCGMRLGDNNRKCGGHAGLHAFEFLQQCEGLLFFFQQGSLIKRLHTWRPVVMSLPAFDAMARRRGASKEVSEGFWNRVMPEPMYFSE